MHGTKMCYVRYELHALGLVTMDKLNCDALARQAADGPEQKWTTTRRDDAFPKLGLMLTTESEISMKTFPDITASTCQLTFS
jgi:hypothetical protein